MQDSPDHPEPDPPSEPSIESLHAQLAHLLHQFTELTQRVEALERTSTPRPITGRDQPRPVAISPEPKPAATESDESPIGDAPSTSAPPFRPIAQTPPTRPTVTPPANPLFDPKKFEWLLGVWGLALAGVIVVVVGVGMFLKYAYDEGLIAAIPPAWRCLTAALLGTALVGTGEVLRRKINPPASSGVSAAGIAIIYAAILAATNLYDLLPVTITFALLAAITVGGVLLGSVSRRVTLSLLSLVGAFLVPPLLATGQPSYYAMPAYLLCLLALGLLQSGWLGGAFAHVRRLAWWGTGVLGTLWLTAVYDEAPAASLVFVTLAWAMTIAELIISARFFGTIGNRPDWPQSSRAGFRVADDGEVSFDPRSLLSPEARWLNAAFGATVWSVTAAAITLDALGEGLDFLAPLGFGVLSVIAAGVTLGARARGLLPALPSPRSALAAALAINAALLTAATIATALGGWVQVAAWAAVGLGAIETASRLRFRAVGLFGFSMLAVALARLLTLDLVPHIQSNPPVQFIGLALGPWSAQLTLVAAVCTIAAWRSRYHTESIVAACLVPWCLATALLHPDASAYTNGPVIALLGAAAAWITLPLKAQAHRVNAYAVAGLGLALASLGQFDATDDYALRIVPLSMVAAGIAWVALAALPRTTLTQRTTSASLAILCGVVAIAHLEATASLDLMLLGHAGYLAFVLLAGVWLVRWSVAEITTTLLVLLAIAWGVTQLNRGEPVLTGTPFAHAGFASAAITVLALLGGGFVLRRLASASEAGESINETRNTLTILAFAAAAILLLATSSIEFVRTARALFDGESARGAVLSIWWSIYAIIMVALGFRVGPPLRWAGLALLGLVAAKVMLYDTMTLNPPSRIVAAITTGLVIIAASVLYAHLVKRLPEPEATSNEPDDTDPSSAPNPNDPTEGA